MEGGVPFGEKSQKHPHPLPSKRGRTGGGGGGPVLLRAKNGGALVVLGERKELSPNPAKNNKKRTRKGFPPFSIKGHIDDL